MTDAQDRGLVLEAGPPGRCDDFRLGGATVDHDPATGQWRMWYYCRDRAMAENGGAESEGPVPPPTLGTGRVALALSGDGAHWQRFDGPLAGGAVFAPASDPARFDSLHLGISDITATPNGWLMWYFAGDGAARHSPVLGDVVGLGLRPGLARSRDGIHWERLPGPEAGGALLPLPEADLYRAWPNAFHDGQRWIMQITQSTPELSHYHTTVWQSRDACDWQPCGPISFAGPPRDYDISGIVTRQVLANPLPGGRRFLMVYTGADAQKRRSIAAADSEDGLLWHRLYDGPVFGVGAPGAWDSLGVAATRLLAVGEQLYFYYYGFQTLGNDAGRRGIGLATAPLGDLRALVRWAGGNG